MKNQLLIIRTLAVLFVLIMKSALSAGTGIWTGAGGSGDPFWLDGVNWLSGTHPTDGDQLVFTNTVSLVSSNNYPVGQQFGGITFATPAGGFVLNGRSISLTNNITDLQVVTPETINLNLTNINSTLTVEVVTNGILNLNGVIAGSGGITKTNGGTMALTSSNRFTGALTVNGGTVTVNDDSNLGTPPGTATAGQLVLNNGTLRVPNTFTLNTNRGIALGPTSGSGFGTLDIGSVALGGATPMLYGGIIANNGAGTGGLIKLSFGGLTLSGANTYTGPTAIKSGTLTLDFSQATAPANNIINSNSVLTLGGATSGSGTTNFAALIMTPKASTVNSQTFSGTTIDTGEAFIRGTANGGGTANINLGPLSHIPGGYAVLLPSALQAGGLGNITTTTTNINGIIGGWATISDGTYPYAIRPFSGTNWASVDSGGNIVGFTNYAIYSTGFLTNVLGPTNNVLIDTSTTGDVVLDALDGTPKLFDVNTITSTRTAPYTLRVGTNQTIRLGKYGAIFDNDTSAGAAAWAIGNSAAGGNSSGTVGPTYTLNIGTLTAGGATDTAGEINFIVNTTNSSSGVGLRVLTAITDNGAGPVTVVKSGPGFMEFGSSNSYSGGTYFLQGRIAGTAPVQNQNCFGTSNLYIFPGCYLYLNPATGNPRLPNRLFIAGDGVQQEKLGCIRFQNAGWAITNVVTLIGDATIGGNNGTPGISGRITGPFNLTFGSSAVVAGSLVIANPNNDWTGNTIMQNRSGASSSLISSNNEVIPNGFGFGNVIMSGFTGGTYIWNLNGNRETVNGLSTIGAGNACVISNSITTSPSILTIGDNDQSGTFGGVITAGAGAISLVKIGGGVETLTTNNTYTGTTTISNGVLQLTGSGSIGNTTGINIFNGKLDVSAVSGYNFGTPTINVTGGTLTVSVASSAAGSLNLTNTTLQVQSLSSGGANLSVPAVTLGGTTNIIQPLGVPLIPAYPAKFPVINYTTSLIGDTNTLVFVSPAGYSGFVTNDVSVKTVYVVLTNGPITPSITWLGLSGTALNSTWDFVASDWTNIPQHKIDSYVDGDIVTFDDVGKTNVVNITGFFATSGVYINNTNVNYTFVGTGAITTNSLNKTGPGRLILDNTGGDTYTGGMSIDPGGTVQIGKNDTGGSLGAGSVGNGGLIVFNRTDNVTVSNAISGTTGSLLVSNAFGTTLALNGGNSFGGSVSVIVSNIVKAGSISALGSTNGSTTIANGAGLDLNGQITAEPVITAGSGVRNLDGSTNGAIYNSSAAPSSIGSVTLTGDTVIGATPDATAGNNRLDISSATAKLDTGGNAYKLTKISANQLSLINATVDSALSDVNVQGGVLDLEKGTTGLGNASANLFLANATTLQVVSLTNKLAKQIQVASTTAEVATIIADTAANSTTTNVIAGAMALNGNVIVNTASGSLILSNTISGAGAFTKNGTGTLTLIGIDSNSGGMTINDGATILNGTNNSTATSSELTANVSANSTVIFGGNGTFKGPADIEDTLWPSVAGRPSTLNIGNNVDYSVPGTGDPGFGALVLGLVSGSSSAVFSLNTATNTGGGINDYVNVTGGINVNNSKVYINPVTPLSSGSIYTLLTYNSGAETSPFGQVSTYPGIQATPNRYKFTLQDTGNGVVRLLVSVGTGALSWNNAAANGTWDMTNSVNWFNNGGGTNDYFAQLDTVVFDDTAPAGATNVTLAAYSFVSGTNTINAGLRPATVTVVSTNNNFTFAGSGKISSSASIAKKGPSILTISTANDFTGTTAVSGGTLVVNNVNALGALTAVTIVTNGGTLDIGGASFSANQNPLMGTRPIFVSGWGVNSNGVVVNNGTVGQNNAFQNFTLIGDAALGGSARWDIGRPSTGSGVLSTGGNAYNLYKVGTNFIALLGVNVDTNLANINVRSGMLGFQQGTLSMGNPTNTMTVETNATLEFFGTAGTNNYTKQFVLNGDGVAASITNESGVTTINGNMTLNGNVIIGVSGTALTNNCVISGSGSLSKTVGSVLVLNTNETYTGNTLVNGGTLQLQGGATIDNSPNISVLAGATLNVNARTNSTFTLKSGQALSGGGTLAGTLTAASGSTVSPGTNGVLGVLTITTNATLSGTTLLDLNASSNTNDVVSVSGNLTIGGTLNVTNLGGSLAGGQSYKLFNAATYITNYTGITPSTPGANMAWDVSGLAVDGTLKIVSSGPGVFTNKPVILSFALNGANVTLTGTNGQAGDAYYLLTTTNLTSPWTVLSTNVIGSVGANGSFTYTGTNVVFPAEGQRFYILVNTNGANGIH